MYRCHCVYISLIGILRTLLDNGVGLMVTLPSSLSSSASIPGFSDMSLTLTVGSGWEVEKSPWVSHIPLPASTWSVTSLLLLSTSMVQ